MACGIAPVRPEDEVDDGDEISDRSNSRSRADWNRSYGILLEAVPDDRARAPAGRTSTAAVSGGGSSRRIALIVSAGVSPWNARLPDTIS